MKVLCDLKAGDVFFHESEYFVKTVAGWSFSLTSNDVRFIRLDTPVEVVKGVMKLTHADIQEPVFDSDEYYVEE